MTDEPQNLPAVPAAEVEEMIFDGEVVNETPDAAPPAVRVTAVTVPPHVRAAAGHVVLVAAGAVVLYRRRQHARQRPERMMRLAEQTGDHEQVREWRQHLEDQRQKRHDRRVKTAQTAVLVAKSLLIKPIAGRVGSVHLPSGADQAARFRTG